ncbi:MAG: hypothetical protein ABFR89_05565 [Actinomycetota bacterium]
MLRACNRVLKPGAPLAFYVVAVSDGLSSGDTARAIEAGPPHVDARASYRELVEAAGFVDVEVVDVTDDYAATMSKAIRMRGEASVELGELIGSDRYVEGQASRRRELDAIRGGLLRRFLISTARP